MLPIPEARGSPTLSCGRGSHCLHPSLGAQPSHKVGCVTPACPGARRLHRPPCSTRDRARPSAPAPTRVAVWHTRGPRVSPAALQTHVHGLGTLPCSVPTLTQGSASALGCRRQHSATGNAEQNCLHTNSPCGWQGCGVPRQQPCMGLPPIASSPSSTSQPSTELLLCHCAWQKGAQGACSLCVSAAPAQAAQFLFPFSQHP